MREALGRARGRRARSAAALWLAALIALAPLVMGVLASMLLPDAPGTDVYKKSGLTVDASHMDQGYIMVKHKADKKRLKVQIACGGETLNYDLNNDGEYEVFPLQLGDGKYRVQAYRQISGSRYSAIASVSINVKLADGKLPFLYPNQFVNYGPDTLAVRQSDDICGALGSDVEKANAVYRYVVKHMTYDYILARTVQTGYLPDLDDAYQKGMGICFDIAAMYACMMRAQGVPTQLVIGYADSAYHAWNLVYLNDQWQRCDPTSDICAIKVKKYTTERVY